MLEAAIQDTGHDPGPAVVALDIDHFKQLNDSQGHHAGDALLEDLVSRWRTVLRHGDVIGRLGGDEFAVLLRATDRLAARRVAERLCSASRAAADGMGATAVTVSVGVAVHRPGDDAASLIRRADTSMYRAKGDGRDRVGPISAAAEDRTG